jgi:hypothetical protein
MFFLPGHEPYLTRNAPLLAREEPLFTGIAFLPGGNELLSEGIVARLGGIGAFVSGNDILPTWKYEISI